MTAWDDLVSTVERWATGSDPVPDDAEGTLLPLVESAAADRSVDRELHPGDTARWLVGLALGHRALRDRSPEADPDRDVADLRLILTRWLHPARPGV